MFEVVRSDDFLARLLEFPDKRFICPHQSEGGLKILLGQRKIRMMEAVSGTQKHNNLWGSFPNRCVRSSVDVLSHSEIDMGSDESRDPFVPVYDRRFFQPQKK